jgi:hypothetical protein
MSANGWRSSDGLAFAISLLERRNYPLSSNSRLKEHLMATAGITPGQPERTDPGAHPSIWQQAFTALERDQLLHDDTIAGRSISIILVVIFLIGLLLSAVAVLMSH